MVSRKGPILVQAIAPSENDTAETAARHMAPKSLAEDICPAYTETQKTAPLSLRKTTLSPLIPVGEQSPIGTRDR